MALKFHPDKNRAPGADEIFKKVKFSQHEKKYLKILKRSLKLMIVLQTRRKEKYMIDMEMNHQKSIICIIDNVIRKIFLLK